MGSAARNASYFTLLDGDEDVLLNWDGYAQSKSQCFPSLPGWWYRLSTRQRAIARGFLCVCIGLALLALITSWLTGGSNSSSSPRRSATPTESQSSVTPPHTEQAWPSNIPIPDTTAPPTDTTPTYGDYTEPQGAGASEPTASLPPSAFPRCSWSHYRLPPAIKPFLYNISLQLDPALTQVNGSVRIALALDEPTPCIVLHADRSMSLTVEPLDTADGPIPGLPPPARTCLPSPTCLSALHQQCSAAAHL